MRHHRIRKERRRLVAARALSVLVLLAALLGGIGLGLLRRGTPVPELAIREAKLTTEALKSNGRT